MRRLLALAVLPLLACGEDGTGPSRTNVGSIAITPAGDQVTGIGGTLLLTAAVTDTLGNPLPAARMSWKSSNTAKVSLSAATGPTVLLTAKEATNGVSVTAASGGRSASVTVVVRDVPAPHISALSVSTLAPGLRGVTLTGTGFAPTVDASAVSIDGVAAQVTAASTTQLTITIPDTGFPCAPLHDAELRVAAGDVASTAPYPFDAGTAVALETGVVTVVPPVDRYGCAELVASGVSRYLVALVNTDAAPGRSVSVRLDGEGIVPVASGDVVSRGGPTLDAVRPAGAGTRARLLSGAWRWPGARHLRLLETDRALVRRAGGPRAAAGRRAGPTIRRALATSAARLTTPQVSDTLELRIRDINTDQTCTRGFTVRARAVYVGNTSVVLEDVTAPLHGTMDSFYQQIGSEFDGIIYPMLRTYFGDPLAYDPQLGNVGRVLMLFSPVVNDNFGGVAGFVSGCDFFPYDTTPGETQDLVSNEAAIFYAYVPTTLDPSATTGVPVNRWKAFIRGVLAHEAKHLASYAAKFANGADDLEELWLEEATAQISSEIYQRTYSHSAWKVPAPYRGSVGCEPPLTEANQCTGDHPQVMLHHFSYLYDYLSHIDGQTPVGNNVETYYGGAWSFVRWVVDHYAQSESQMLHEMTQATHEFGVDNLTARTGDSFAHLVLGWSVASALTRYAGPGVADPTFAILSWDQRDIFAGMHAQLVNTQTNQDAFPLAYPLEPVRATFGTLEFGTAFLRSGGSTYYELGASPGSRQTLAVRSADGAELPANTAVRMVVVRLQ